MPVIELVSLGYCTGQRNPVPNSRTGKYKIYKLLSTIGTGRDECEEENENLRTHWYVLEQKYVDNPVSNSIVTGTIIMAAKDRILSRNLREKVM